MADAGVVNALPSANDAQVHPVAAPAPAPVADDGKRKAPAANDDEGKGKLQPWEGRPCVVLALGAATAPVEPKPKRRRQANRAPAPAANRERLESREAHVAAHALPTTPVAPPVSENHPVSRLLSLAESCTVRGPPTWRYYVLQLSVR